MTQAILKDASIRYALLFVLPWERKVLLEEGELGPTMPTMEISRYARPAEELTYLAAEKWSLHSLVIDWLPGSANQEPCAILEVLSSGSIHLCSGFGVYCIDDLPEGSITSELFIHLCNLTSRQPDPERPFSRFGWLDEAQRWIKGCIGAAVPDFTEIRQLNASSSFALIRLGAIGGEGYWFKAVGVPNTHEYSTTAYLIQHCKEYLPRVIGMRADWNAWVMEEFGSSLTLSDSLADFELATARLAELQKLQAGKAEHLLASQFIDHTAETLNAHVDELIVYLIDAMKVQTSTKVAPLTSSRLREIGLCLHAACKELASLRIPDSVIHGDISPGSILSDGTNCVFTDWCEAYVGNPFISLEQFCLHVSRKSTPRELWVPHIRSIYSACWSDLLSNEQISGALRLAPLISTLSYLWGRGDWLHTDRSRDSNVQAFARALARQMDRCISNRIPSEVLCPSN